MKSGKGSKSMKSGKESARINYEQRYQSYITFVQPGGRTEQGSNQNLNILPAGQRLKI
jgi:hypothetical protein